MMDAATTAEAGSVPLSLTHYVSLSGFGGVEQQFAAFVRRAAERQALDQSVVACSRRIHTLHREALAGVGHWRYEKKVCGFKLPQRPAQLRRVRYRWLARTLQPDVALLWNRLGEQARVLDVLGPRRCLYWEHGSAWLAGGVEAKRAVLDRLPAVICNSRAARRMLELHWQYRGVVRVCPNGMRSPQLAAAPRRRAADAPVRLGTASRLVPVKATCLAIHTLAALVERGVDAWLDIAGDGPLRGDLAALADALGVASRLRFRGVVADMAAFYEQIDLLLHPALREPFGVVAAEAAAAGCPVVCSAVDGLPEAVAHGHGGYCVPVTAGLERFRALGGSTDGLPPVVYDPVTDRIVTPRICEPAALADAVMRVIADPDRYARMSAAAIAHVRTAFDFDAHVDDVLAAASEYAATGTLAPAA